MIASSMDGRLDVEADLTLFELVIASVIEVPALWMVEKTDEKKPVVGLDNEPPGVNISSSAGVNGGLEA